MSILKPTRGILLNKTHPLAHGLVGCWLMNEATGAKVADLSGNKNDGTMQGDISWSAGGCGSALDFNGINAYGVLPATNILMPNNNSWTIGIRFRPHSLASTGRIMNLHRGATPASAIVISVFSNDKVRFTYYTGSAFKNETIKLIDIGAWSYVHLSYNGTQFARYYNGVEQGSPVVDTFSGFGSHPCDWGSYNQGAQDFYDGIIEHVLIYNRALSAVEIAWLYREPFCMFKRAIRPGLIGSPIVNLAGASTALSSLSATAKAIRKVGGTVAGTSDVAALLNSIRGEESSLDIERSWLREALFNGMTANAFKLGTTLSLSWFWVRVAGCSVLYRGPSIQGIDFTNILTVAEQNACEISLPSYIPHNSGSTYFYVIRRFNNCGYQELTLAAAAKVSIDASGDLEKPQPNNIFSSKAEQVNGNKIQLVWFYCPLEQKSQPVCFNVYYNGGMGQIDYENPLAKISYEGRRFYSYQSGALGAGRYLFTIRAEDADGIENSSSAQLKIQLDTTNPDAIDILSTETV